MHKQWVHKELAVQRGGYIPGQRISKETSPRSKDRSRTRMNVSFIMSVATLLTLVLTLPLIFLKASTNTDPSIFVVSLPKIHGGELLPRLEDNYLEELSPIQQRQFAGQVHFLTQIIKTTKNPRINAEELAFLIVSESHKHNYDPFLVASIILAESSFRQDARSSVGAMGLMQIRPNTGRYVAKLHHVRWRGPTHLNDPRYNITLGINYIKYLTKMFDGNMTHTLVAYNWGM